jgi:signal transduction histidine kinase
VSVSASLLQEGSEEMAWVAILVDQRERLSIERRLTHAEEKLRETEKQAMIAELAGAAAHELNQPLTSVLGYADLLKRKIPAGDPGYRPVEIIYREAERMAEIVRKIGRITRYETTTYLGNVRIVDIDKATDK